jgi:hypothetical protein
MAGLGGAMAGHHYVVCIEFREPTYEIATAEVREEPFTWTLNDVEALDEEEARTVAVDRFRDLAALSGVGWVREIEAVRVSLA